MAKTGHGPKLAFSSRASSTPFPLPILVLSSQALLYLGDTCLLLPGHKQTSGDTSTLSIYSSGKAETQHCPHPHAKHWAPPPAAPLPGCLCPRAGHRAGAPGPPHTLWGSSETRRPPWVGCVGRTPNSKTDLGTLSVTLGCWHHTPAREIHLYGSPGVHCDV